MRHFAFLVQVKKWNVSNHPSDLESLRTYNETGVADFGNVQEKFEESLDRLLAEAGEILKDNLQDRTVRAGLSLAGWKPELTDYPMAAEAVEWWLWGTHIESTFKKKFWR